MYTVESLRNFLGRFHLSEGSSGQEEKPKPEQLLKELTLEGIADFIKEGKCEPLFVYDSFLVIPSPESCDHKSFVLIVEEKSVVKE